MSDEVTSASGLVVPKWLPRVGIIICILGIADSVYLTITHYTTAVVLACPESSTINCAKVTSSSYATILGIPLVFLGLLFFIGMLVLQTRRAWQSRLPIVRWARLAGGASGVLMVAWLIYVELFKLNAICLYCTGVHILALALFIISVLGTAYTSE